MKKFIVAGVALAIGFLSYSFVIPHHGPHCGDPEKRVEHRIMRMKEHLGLSENQIEKVRAIELEFGKKMHTFHTENRGKLERSEMHEAMKQLLDAKDLELAKVLTSNQMQKFIAERPAPPHHPHQKPSKASMEKMHGNTALKGELKQYFEKNMLPTLLEKRTELEANLSAEEKSTLSNLRETMHKNRPKGQRPQPPKTEEERQAMHEKREAMRKMMEPAHQILLAHKAEMVELHKGLETKHLEWRADLVQIVKNNVDGATEEDVHAVLHHFRRRFHLDPMGFLMMDINKKMPVHKPEKEEPVMSETMLRVYPNPSTSVNNLELDVKIEGIVHIDLMDREGNFVRTVFEGYQKAGKQTIQLDVSDLKVGTYFYQIRNASGVSTTKIVIQD